MSGAKRTGLVRYDEAWRALAAALRIDEVKDISNKAAAMAHYARQAKDHELIILATEIRMRAERRLGEIMDEQRKAGRLAKPPNPKRRVAKKPDDPATLAEQGVGKALADRARKAAAMPADQFERQVAETVQVAVAATAGRGKKEEKTASTSFPKAAAAANKLNRELMGFYRTFTPKFEAWIESKPTDEGLDEMHNALRLVTDELLRLASEISDVRGAAAPAPGTDPTAEESAAARKAQHAAGEDLGIPDFLIRKQATDEAAT